MYKETKYKVFTYLPPFLSFCLILFDLSFIGFLGWVIYDFDEKIGNMLYGAPKMVFENVALGEGYFEHKSKGYNTVETDENGHKTYEYYLLNNTKYSNVYIRAPLEEDNNFPGIRYEIYQGKDGSGHLSWVVPLLADWPSSQFWGYHYQEPKKVQYTGVSRIETYKDGKKVKYYNTPEFEIEQKYISLFVQDISIILGNRFIAAIHENYERHQNYERENENYKKNYDIAFLMYLDHFTKEELAIIRNCLFAKHGYEFQSVYWIKFIENYYSKDYKGIYTNSEVMEFFTSDEKWLLDLIQEHEKNK
ncbi:hypothetical protein FACS189491_05690 [Spirochaetia bacterium]|nr:hypothetical protein FACS189491_05690 [Spirochaetia bacterium]